MRPALAAALFAALVTPHAVDALPHPLLSDPAGDVSIGPMAVPAGLEWADITEAWVDEVQASTWRINIRVADPDPAFVQGVVILHFQIGDEAFFGGYGAVLPYSLGHGFYCPSNGKGSATGPCPDVPGTLQNGVFSATLPREALGASPGSTLHTVWAESGIDWAHTAWTPFDDTAIGATYTFPN